MRSTRSGSVTQFSAGLGIDNAVDFIVSCKMSDLSWLQMVVSHKKTLGFPGKLLSFSTSAGSLSSLLPQPRFRIKNRWWELAECKWNSSFETAIEIVKKKKIKQAVLDPNRNTQPAT